jgi:N-methylhydantoinase A
VNDSTGNGSHGRYRVGIDIGGTFTDGTLIDEETGAFRIAKVLSTPDDPSVGFMTALHRLLTESDVAPAAVRYLVHATTVATNAIIEGKTAKTGFVTTDGFRDMLEIARQTRPSLYDVHFVKPPPLVPRYRCFGIKERMSARGEVALAFDRDEMHRVAGTLKDQGVEAIAVCFLHSYANPEHERIAAEIIRDVAPDILVSTSSDVAPQFREYYRASTTVINAAIRPVVANYVENVESRLDKAGVQCQMLVMQSSGGVYSSEAARERPVFMVESGPAAGVIAAAYIGGEAGYENVLSFDMGGTTAKVGLIEHGTPSLTKEYEVGTTAVAGIGDRRGSGYPIRASVIDLVEIGAGGGSIAWVDSGGLLRIGPRSAGADPGPACYGRGGREPTVTDANLVLGRLNASYFLGGEIPLDEERATAAIAEHCAGPLGIDVIRAAYNIVEIANIAMINAIRLVSVQRGHDPRDFALVAFGGAGPVHANRLAEANEIGTTIIPFSPGITSALGLLSTDLKQEYTATLMLRADQPDMNRIESTFAGLEQQGTKDLERQNVLPADRRLLRQIDMRYAGQSYELTLDCHGEEFSEQVLARLMDDFHQEHYRTFGFSAPDEPMELVNVRVLGVGVISRPGLRGLGEATSAIDEAEKARRPVVFDPDEGPVTCPIYDRYRLPLGAVVRGPAIVEEIDSTTVLDADYQATVSPHGYLVITRGNSRAAAGA